MENFTSTDGVFATNLEASGNLTIYCNIHDNTTDFSESTNKSFFVSKTNLDFEFSSITTTSDNNGHKKKAATIICPAYDEITFTLRSRASSPAIVRVNIGSNGSGYHILTPYQQKEVKYWVVKGEELNCYIEIVSGQTGAAANMEITSLKYHINNIGEPNKLNVDID